MPISLRLVEPPARLGVNVGYADYIKDKMMTEYNIPDTRPILTDSKSLYLVESRDKKYYLWNDISEDVARIEEPSLQKILALLGSGGLSGIFYTFLTSFGQDIEDAEYEPVEVDVSN